MPEWKTSQPPIGVEVEYFRDNGICEKAVLERCGSFGTGPGGKAPRMRPQFRKTGASGLDLFEVTRWREIEPSE